jgi:signal transduction histidine kinase
MQQVMDNLLTIARAQAGKIEFSPKLEDLDPICQDIIEELHSRPGYEGRIRYEYPRVPVITVVDERMIRQIVSNLLSNALKYSTAEVRLSVSFDDEQTTIQVVDHGIGIPPEELESVGQPFHRAQNVGTISGTGLGLSITRQAVQAHDGELQITSEVGIGTTCLVILPNRQHGDVQ